MIRHGLVYTSRQFCPIISLQGGWRRAVKPVERALQAVILLLFSAQRSSSSRIAREKVSQMGQRHAIEIRFHFPGFKIAQ
jgi:hypothetical protein